MPGKKPFRNMTLQIPLTSRDVVDFYSLPEFDREILVDDVRTFITTKLQALRAITPGLQPPLLIGQTPAGIPGGGKPVPAHKKQLKSSYSPKGGFDCAN